MNEKLRNTLLAVLMVLVLGLGLTACEEKETPPEPASAPLSNFRFLRVLVDAIVDNNLSVNNSAKFEGAAGTATPLVNVRRQAVGDLAYFVGGTTTPTVVVVIRQAEVEINRDLDQNARAHINPAETPGATTTPVAVFKAASNANDVLSLENAAATPVWQVDYAGNSIQAGDAQVGDTLNVDGDIDLDGDGFDVNITTAFSIDADLASNINLAAGDLTLEAETGSVVIKGDEAVADAIYLDANDAAGTGISAVVGATGGFNIDGGLTKIGGGTNFTRANGDNDVAIAADLEVRGGAYVVGSAVITGSLSVDTTANLDDLDVDATAEINLDGALVDIGDDGANAYTRANGDNDLGVAGDAEVRGGLYVGGATVLTGTVVMDGALVKVGGSTAYSRANGVNDLGVEGDIEARGGAYIVGNEVVTGTLSITGISTFTAAGIFSTWMRATPQTAITVTQGSTLSPTGTYQPIAAAGNLSFGAITAGAAGSWLYLTNTTNTTITITDTATIMLGGNRALTQYDSLLLMSDGTNWLEISFVAN